jgi:hypothetical protein
MHFNSLPSHVPACSFFLLKVSKKFAAIGISPVVAIIAAGLNRLDLLCVVASELTTEFSFCFLLNSFAYDAPSPSPAQFICL